jgi:hypothetical protein
MLDMPLNAEFALEVISSASGKIQFGARTKNWRCAKRSSPVQKSRSDSIFVAKFVGKMSRPIPTAGDYASAVKDLS